MSYFTRYDSEHGTWQGSAFWKAVHQTQEILIPIETTNTHLITGFVVLEDSEFPREGQNTLFDYAGESFRESCASLTIHRELGDPLLEQSYLITLLKLAHAIDQSNAPSLHHAVKTAFWAKNIAVHMQFSKPDLDQIELASMLHDVGKVVVPKTILTKPSQLSEQDWMIMRRHPTYGAMLMKPSFKLHDLIPFVEAHHEFFNGFGYPKGLVGEDIPIQARIISIADAFATMTEPRVYRSASTRSQAISELQRCSGTQFDPEIVKIMVETTILRDLDDSNCNWGVL